MHNSPGFVEALVQTCTFPFSVPNAAHSSCMSRHALPCNRWKWGDTLGRMAPVQRFGGVPANWRLRTDYGQSQSSLSSQCRRLCCPHEQVLSWLSQRQFGTVPWWSHSITEIQGVVATIPAKSCQQRDRRDKPAITTTNPIATIDDVLQPSSLAMNPIAEDIHASGSRFHHSTGLDYDKIQTP